MLRSFKFYSQAKKYIKMDTVSPLRGKPVISAKQFNRELTEVKLT